jgi:hypothetical protein
MSELKTFSPKTENKIALENIVFHPEKATLLLPISNEIPNLKIKSAEAERLGLSEKEEFHFTVIGNSTGEEILDSIKDFDEKEKENRLNEILKLAEAIKWKLSLKNIFFHVQKEYSEPDPINPEFTNTEKRQSIIQMAEIEGLDEFYQKINILIGKQFKTPMPHITLYTTSSIEDRKLRGIGINSKEQFKALNPKKID